MGKANFRALIVIVYVMLAEALAFIRALSAQQLHSTGSCLIVDKDPEAWHIINAESNRQARK